MIADLLESSNKTESLANLLRKQIDQGVYLNGVLPREMDISRNFKVSRVTVRRALDILENDGLIDRVKRKGTLIKGAPGSIGFSNIIGVIMPNQEHYYMPLRASVEQALETRELFSVSVAPCEKKPPPTEYCRRIQSLLTSPIAGIIYHGHGYFRYPYLNNECSIPSVALECFDAEGEPPGGGVFVDFSRVIELALEHFAGLGRKRICCLINKPAQLIDASESHIRNHPVGQFRKGFIRTVKRLKLERLVEWHDIRGNDASKHIDFYRGILARKDHPTAIFCETDHLCIQLMNIARELGLRVPEDVAFIGMRNTPWCVENDIKISSVCLNTDEMAEKAVAMLSGEIPMGVKTIKPSLIVRESCGAEHK